jgi:hypothetical protein
MAVVAKIQQSVLAHKKIVNSAMQSSLRVVTFKRRSLNYASVVAAK